MNYLEWSVNKYKHLGAPSAPLPSTWNFTIPGGNLDLPLILIRFCLPAAVNNDAFLAIRRGSLIELIK